MEKEPFKNETSCIAKTAGDRWAWHDAAREKAR